MTFLSVLFKTKTEQSVFLKYGLCLLAVFFLSRAFWYWKGLEFSFQPFDNIWQFLEFDLLKNDLLRSLFYLHSQPPGFNLFLGIVIKLSGSYYPSVLRFIYFILGLNLSLMIYFLMTVLRVPVRLSFALACFFVLSPAAILYENWLFYTFPAASLLCLSAVLLHWFALTESKRAIAFFWGLLAVLIYIYGQFQIYWFLAVLACLCFLNKEQRRRIFLASLLPLFLVLALYLKNLTVFHFWGTGSWLGMNLASRYAILKSQYPEEKLAEKVKKGELDPIILLPAFQPVKVYESVANENYASSIPALNRPYKAGGEYINYNHLIYVQLSKRYLKAYRAFAVSAGSRLFAWSEIRSLAKFFYPAEEYHFLNKYPNKTTLRPLMQLYSLFYGDPFYLLQLIQMPKSSHAGLFIAAAWALSIVYGGRLLWRQRKERSPEYFLLLFMFLTIVYISAVTLNLEKGECHRMRFMIDPFTLTMLGKFLADRKPCRSLSHAAVEEEA